VLHTKAGICLAAECLDTAPETLAMLRHAIAVGERVDCLWKHVEIQSNLHCKSVAPA